MSLTPLSLLIVVATALLGIVGEWSAEASIIPVWRVVAIAWVTGLGYECFYVRRLEVSAGAEGVDSLFLGRKAELGLKFLNGGRRAFQLQYTPALPEGLEGSDRLETLTVAPGDTSSTSVAVMTRRLGKHPWGKLPARIKGPLGFAWWSRPLTLDAEIRVLPDTLGAGQRDAFGTTTIGAARHVVGSGGSELQQLREYQPGDPRRAIDWKASARTGKLITRIFSEDQHLEVMIAIDAGRTSRTESHGMSQLAHYANLAARFAEYAVLNEDRVGLVAFADQPIVTVAPARGMNAVLGIRRALADLSPQPVESDAVSAILHLRRLVRHRSLVVLLTDLYERSASSQLAESVRILRPTHLPVIVGLIGEEVVELTEVRARHWLDPYRSLAATEYQRDIRANVSRLIRMGASAMIARPLELDHKVFERYRLLRAQRRV